MPGLSAWKRTGNLTDNSSNGKARDVGTMKLFDVDDDWTLNSGKRENGWRLFFDESGNWSVKPSRLCFSRSRSDKPYGKKNEREFCLNIKKTNKRIIMIFLTCQRTATNALCRWLFWTGMSMSKTFVKPTIALKRSFSGLTKK